MPAPTTALASSFFQSLLDHGKNLVNFNGSILMDILFLALFLGLATLVKKALPFLERYLVPNAIIAGFIGIVLGPELLKATNFSRANIEQLIYHLMSIGFIALALKERDKGKTVEAGRSGMFIVSTYLVQGVAGLAVTLGFIYLVDPTLFPTFGFFLPLGYGQGPGQCLALGQQWEKAGFVDGTNTGLFFATMGALWACIGGVFYVNWLIRRKKVAPKSGVAGTTAHGHEVVVEKDVADESQLSASIDRLTVQVILIGVVYLATYVTVYVIDFLLRGKFGSFGTTFANMIQGFAFIIGSVYGLLFRVILDKLRAKGVIRNNHPNNYLLNRISGLSFDFMVTASVAILSFTAIAKYWLPTAVLGLGGGFLTIWWCTWIGRKVFVKYPLENLAAQYGMLTGTISNGMALLREVDPDFSSDAADNLVLGSGTGLAVGLPLLILINVPVTGYSADLANGTHNAWIYYLATLAALAVYAVILTFLMIRRKKPKTAPTAS